MVTLHDAIKTIQNGVFVFFSKEHKPVSLKKNKKTDLKNRRLFQKLFFLKPNYLSIFFAIFPWSHDLKQVTSLSVWLGARRTPRVYVSGNEEAENW